MSFYNANEIIKIAIQIEKNGEDFYRTAAESRPGEHIHDMLINLANWEVNHADLFSKLQEKLPDDLRDHADIFDTEDLTYKYLKAAADSHIFVKNTNMELLVETCETPRDILELALTFEKDSVVLYRSMVENMKHNDYRGQAYIEEIAMEELKHVSIIQDSIYSYEEA
ncbi:MAG: ferritin-like domain-containing protein [Fibrobacterota bacterium]